MNMKLAIKNWWRGLNFKRVGPAVLILSTVVASVILYQHFITAQGEAGSPEKYTTDLNGNPKNSFKVNESGYLNLKIYTDDSSASPSPAPNPSSTPTTAANIKVSEKLTQQVTFNKIVSATDKGGTTRDAVLSQPSGDPKIYFNLTQIPKSYVCDSSKAECRNNGQQSGNSYTIYDNYVVLQIQFTSNQKGSYDLDSNYEACDTASPRKISGDSKVEYTLASGGGVYKNFEMPAMCVTIGSGVALNVVKTTYDKDWKRKATFEAGEEVKVRLEVDEPEDARVNYEIDDAIPKSVSGDIIYKFYRQQDGYSKDGLKATIGDGKITITGREEIKLLGGRNTFEYSYKI